MEQFTAHRIAAFSLSLLSFGSQAQPAAPAQLAAPPGRAETAQLAVPHPHNQLVLACCTGCKGGSTTIDLSTGKTGPNWADIKKYKEIPYGG